MLDYIALGLIIFSAITLFYVIIAIHDIPYEIAKARQHPQQDAIHVAGWVSLLTLHVMWPFLWIWATLYRPDRGWGFLSDSEDKQTIPKLQVHIEQLQAKLTLLESQENTNNAQHTLQINDLISRIQKIEANGQKEGS